MSKTLWNTIKIEVPNEMVNITKNDKVTVKKSLTKTNNISKSNKEPSIKIIAGDVNKPKIISDGKEWNVEELKIRMKKAKDLSKKNEGKEHKKEITKDKAAKIITKEITSRANLNKADIYLQLKSKSLEELRTIIKRVVQFSTHKDFTTEQSTRTISGLADWSKDELIERIIKFRNTKVRGKDIPLAYFDLSVPVLDGNEHYRGGGYSKRKGRRIKR